MEKLPFATEIQTERLVLKQRKLTLETAKALSDLIRKNKAFLAQWMPWTSKPNTPEECLKSSLRATAKWDNLSAAEYLIYDKSGHLVGGLCMKDIDYDLDRGEIGYWLGEEFCGKGYVTEAVKALENEFFDRGMERIVIQLDSLNRASEKVALRCGYVEEGTLRHNEWNAERTERRDTKIFSKLKGEWKK